VKGKDPHPERRDVVGQGEGGERERREIISVKPRLELDRPYLGKSRERRISRVHGGGVLFREIKTRIVGYQWMISSELVVTLALG
jgi:hypothetical protein